MSRLARFGSAAAGVSGNMLVEGAGRLLRRESLSLSDLLLTPANLARVTDQLARLRGAAMKIGQLISMDAGTLLPPEPAAVMARLRESAEPMPERQLRGVLDANWGPGWQARLASFDFQPVAAASIGQVHKAVTHAGKALAVKVQYPGVRESIGSDVDNVAALLRLAGIVPSAVELGPLLAEARRQLHEEADYRHEARCLDAFGQLLAGDAAFVVPVPEPELSNENVLAMSFVEGQPIEALENASQAERDGAATRLFDLALRELFAFGLMQTDPNFANYRYQADTGRIALLDFGATRAFAPELAVKFKRLLKAGLEGDRDEARAVMIDIGILEADHPRLFQAYVLAMFDTLFKAVQGADLFDFADTGLVKALERQAIALGEHRDMLRAPPVDVLFLQRKAGGLFLLAARLKAKVPLARMLRTYAEERTT